MIGETVRTLLFRDATLSNRLRESNGAIRVFPNKKPQESVSSPFVVYTVVDEVDWNTLNNSSDLIVARLQVDCYAKDGQYKECQRLADEVKAVLHNRRLPGFFAIQTARRGMYEDSGQQAMHRVICEFELWINMEALNVE